MASTDLSSLMEQMRTIASMYPKGDPRPRFAAVTFLRATLPHHQDWVRVIIWDQFLNIPKQNLGAIPSELPLRRSLTLPPPPMFLRILIQLLILEDHEMPDSN